MISKILVPVDFSTGSANCLRYAEAMAVAVGAQDVHVIHVFTPQTATANTLSVAPMEELMNDRDEGLKKFLSEISAPEGINRKSELLLGFATDKIIGKSNAYDLVVLGANGETDLLEEVFGSISSAVAQKAECPVLLVPSQAGFWDYEHILYASNSLSLSRSAVLKFKDFNSLFEARVHFVHVNETSDEPKPGEREALFAPLFSNPDPEFAFELHEVQAESVQEGLVDYLQQHTIDLAVMVTKQRGFWGRLFHHSDTKQMVLHPKTPMLVLHEE